MLGSGGGTCVGNGRHLRTGREISHWGDQVAYFIPGPRMVGHIWALVRGVDTISDFKISHL